LLSTFLLSEKAWEKREYIFLGFGGSVSFESFAPLWARGSWTSSGAGGGPTNRLEQPDFPDFNAIKMSQQISNQIQAFGKKFPILLKTPSPKGQVELIEIIGKGNYGNVYRVSWEMRWLTTKAKLTETGTITAVKVVELKEDELKETLLEMEILARCKHVNITAFMGMYLKNLDLWVRKEFVC
jgi:hypothetical protein